MLDILVAFLCIVRKDEAGCIVLAVFVEGRGD